MRREILSVRRAAPSYARVLVGALEVTRLAYRAPGGRQLFEDVSFRVGDGEHAALVGANGVGKTTLVRVIAGDEPAAGGTISVDGRLGVMRQFVGSIRDQTTVRELLLGVSAPEIRDADARLVAAERAADASGSPEAGLRLANAWAHWGDVGGYDAEVLWDACTVAAMRSPLVGGRIAPRPHAVRRRAEAFGPRSAAER